ncbi:hypothetical protein HS088_TW13G00975 [Tripterygium wilfordii]|uniref:Uncharacterized protein n=1 Tax=Tripterygium wilfordii TaxID=458696 RepID=A0A7J7CVF1_TRIWF|nr:hypothetical protein HS088_TW13G00975 [Tripterygium wilfordii]
MMMRYRRWPLQNSSRGGGGGGSSSRRGFRINSKRFWVRGRFMSLSRWKIWYGQALKKIIRICNKRSGRTRLVVDRPECHSSSHGLGSSRKDFNPC